MYLGTAPAEELEQLAAAFEGSSSAEARELAERMVASNRIYGPFTGRGGSVYEANREREHLMKENFLARYRPVRAGRDAPPKVFVKLGANHLFRGLSPTHVLSTGTFLDELAVTEGVRTYSVHVDCRGGEALNVMTDAPEPCESYFLGSGSVLADALPSDRIVVVDLRSLRSEPAILERLDETSRDLVWAFDGYVAVPNTEPATFFPGERPKIGG
jgi:hypothetical protein